VLIAISRKAPAFTHPLHLQTAEQVAIRAADPHDSDMIQCYVSNLAPDSRRNRFLGALNELSAADLHGMTHGDQDSYPALIAETVVTGIRVMIGEARYALAPDGLSCEFALSVAEDWRHNRLGTLLIEIVASQADALGARYLIGDVLRSNDAMIALARKIGFSLAEPIANPGLVRITKDLFCLDAPGSESPHVWCVSQSASANRIVSKGRSPASSFSFASS
jgi:GNAT superfamily N-acetyltransferase